MIISSTMRALRPAGILTNNASSESVLTRAFVEMFRDGSFGVKLLKRFMLRSSSASLTNKEYLIDLLS